MARFKIESLAAYRASRGLPLADRLIAYLPRYAGRMRGLAWLPKFRNRVPAAAYLGERWLGLSARRSLPAFKGDYLAGTCAAAARSARETKEVVLFVDTFTNYFDHDNAHAAKRVLERAGYTVHTNARPGQRPLCCGRTFLSAGLVDEARAEARRTIAALAHFVERGVAIVGLEPSCLLGMRDEFLSYRLGTAAENLARHALMFEEFLVREKASERFALQLQPIDCAEAMLHGHCHQKSFAAIEPAQTVLNWIPGLTTRLIESSCCGMAGAFGYEARHYDISMKMAESALLPAVRSAAPNAIIVADGFSCRHQIRDGSGRDALHVARIVERALPRDTASAALQRVQAEPGRIAGAP